MSANFGVRQNFWSKSNKYFCCLGEVSVLFFTSMYFGWVVFVWTVWWIASVRITWCVFKCNPLCSQKWLPPSTIDMLILLVLFISFYWKVFCGKIFYQNTVVKRDTKTKQWFKLKIREMLSNVHCEGDLPRAFWSIWVFSPALNSCDNCLRNSS